MLLLLLKEGVREQWREKRKTGKKGRELLWR
jgi:hypothetical protein